MVRIAIATLLALAISVLAAGEEPGAANKGNGQGKQFITGACASDADCASGCCSVDTKACAARLVAEEKNGCGFVDNGGNGQQGGKRQKKKQAQQQVQQQAQQQAQQDEDDILERRMAQPLRA